MGDAGGGVANHATGGMGNAAMSRLSRTSRCSYTDISLSQSRCPHRFTAGRSRLCSAHAHRGFQPASAARDANSSPTSVGSTRDPLPSRSAASALARRCDANQSRCAASRRSARTRSFRRASTRTRLHGTGAGAVLGASPWSARPKAPVTDRECCPCCCTSSPSAPSCAEFNPELCTCAESSFQRSTDPASSANRRAIRASRRRRWIRPRPACNCNSECSFMILSATNPAAPAHSSPFPEPCACAASVVASSRELKIH